MTLRLALWQGAGVPGDIRATLDETERLVAEARAGGAGLVVFPEGFLTGYHVPGLTAEDLAPVEAALASLGRIAAGQGIAVVMGTHLAAPEGLRNAAVAFSAEGRELGRYHKRALFGDWEKATFRPGEDTLRFDCGGLRVGVLICYDVEFPELVRAEARAGAGLVVVPTALMAPQDRIARQMVAVRAMENQLFLGYANRIGVEPGLSFVGLSSINGPDGETLARAEAEPQMLFADIDPQAIARTRAESCYLDDVTRLSGG